MYVYCRDKNNIIYKQLILIMKKKNIKIINVLSYEEADIIIKNFIYINNKKILNQKFTIGYQLFNDKLILEYNYNKKQKNNFVPFYFYINFSENHIQDKIKYYIDKYYINKQKNNNDLYILKNIYSEKGIGIIIIKLKNLLKINIKKIEKNINFINLKEIMIKNKIDINKSYKYIIQKYIENPYLYDKCKSDIATHLIMIKKENQIYFYLSKNIIFRSTMEEYDNNNLALNKHLTNQYIHENINHLLLSKIFIKKDIKKIYKKIIKKTLLMLKSDKFNHYLKNLMNNKNLNICNIFRLDFMLTNKLNIYILEINNNPSLEYFKNDLKKANPIIFTIKILYNIFYNNNDINKNNKIIKKYKITNLNLK